MIYPRVMSKSVDVPGAVTVIAALIGAALLGVVGALLAIPTAAAILMLTREVVGQAPGRALTVAAEGGCGRDRARRAEDRPAERPPRRA